MKAYMDNASTTKIDPKVLEAMQPYLTEKYGNPSSLFYSLGLEAGKALEDSRKKIASLLGAQKHEIIFTASGTESINLALKEIAFANLGKKIVSTKIEHPAIMETLGFLETMGMKVKYVDADKEGIVNSADIEKSITENTCIVAVGHANVEIGTIQPIAEIGKICKQKKVLFFCDASTSIGQIPVNVQDLNVDMLSFTAHKIYGPKGVACLYVKKGTPLRPFIHGGGHEFNLRSGTENVAGIVSLAKALEIAVNNLDSESDRLTKLRDKLIDGLLKTEDSWLNGSKEKRLPGNVNIGFKYIEGEAIVLSLDSKEIAASTGSACSSKNLKASHVLLALGQKPEETHGSLRLTIGRYNTEKDVDYVLQELPKVISELRKMSPYGKGKAGY